MAATFPTSPVDGQQANVNNIVYQYSASSQSWARVLNGVYQIGNGISSMSFATANGNAYISIGGTSNVAVFATTGMYSANVFASTNVYSDNVFASNGMYSANVIVPNQDQVVAYIFAF